nr:molybdopterin-dependent oxidoreductase [Deltaproteobacteria bacterium]
MREKLRLEKMARANSVRPGRWYSTTCKMCIHTCALRAHVSNKGVVDKIEGDPTSPSNKGKCCVKANTGAMRNYDPYRLKKPVKRTNPRKGPGEDPGWVEISWDEALDLVASKMKAMIEKDPREFCYAITDFHKIYNWAWPGQFGNANQFHVIGTYCGGAYHVTAGIYNSAFAGVGDYERCKYWIGCGTGDGFSSHLHVAAAQRMMADARDRGMKVVVVEPRLSTSAAKADEWIPIRPACDRHFVLGLIHTLMYEHKIYDAEYLKWFANGGYLINEEGWFHRSSTEKALPPEGRPEGSMRWFRQTREERYKPMVWDPVDKCAKVFDDPTIKDIALEGTYEVDGKKVRPAFQYIKDAYKEYTPEWAEKITTVPADTIRRIAKEFGEAAQIGSSITIDGEVYPYRPVSFNWYRGAQGHKFGTMDNQSYILLNMLVGSYNAPGGLLGVTLGSPHMVWTDEPGPDGILDPKPHQLHPEVPFAWPPNTTTLMEIMPLGVDPGQFNQLTLTDPEKYDITFKPKICLLYHSNTVWSNVGNVEKWHDIMRSFEFVWAIELFHNESSTFADVILPDRTFLESWALLMCEPPATEGLNCRQPVVEPLGETRDSYDILAEIAERMGTLPVMNDIYSFITGLVNTPDLMLDPQKRYTHKEFLDRCAHYWTRSVWPPERGIEWFMENGHNTIWRPPTHKYYMSDKRGRDMRRPFYCEYILQQKKHLQEQLKNVKLKFDWSFKDYAAFPDGSLSPVHSEPPEYDMYAITYKEHFMNFTENLSIPWIREIADRDPHHVGLIMNPKTAKAKGLQEGDYIEVRSQFGQLTGWLVYTEGIHPEVIGVSNATNRTVTHSPITRLGGGQFNTLLGNNFEYTDLCTGAMETVARVKITKLPAPPLPERY